MWWLLLGAGFWISCGLLARGYALAFFQGYYPDLAEVHLEADRHFAATWGFFSGPFGLLVLFMDRDFKMGHYGWRWK